MRNFVVYLIFSVILVLAFLHYLPVSHSQITDLNLFNNSHSYTNAENPKLAVHGNNVYVLWEDHSGNHTDILFKKSSNNGTSWSSIFKLTNSSNSEGLGCPQIAAAGSNVYVVWAADTGILFRKASDNDKFSFTGTINLTDSSNSDGLGCPQIAAAGSNVYVVWTHKIEQENGEIKLRLSRDNGIIFGKIITLNNNGGYGSFRLSGAGNDVYIVWDDYAANDASDIFFKKGFRKGANFGNIFKLINEESASRNPEVVVNKANLYVVWEDHNLGISKILLSKSTKKGDSWSEPIAVSEDIIQYSDEK